jgi:protein-S-isoprenylcysteine O-methyltransferase Ste14
LQRAGTCEATHAFKHFSSTHHGGSPRGANSDAPTPDRPGVRIPPPIIYAAAFLICLLLQTRLSLPFLPSLAATALGIALVCGGGALVAASIPTMLRYGGTLNTNGASRRLVTTGVYRLSRNPMYLGLALLYSGLACLFGVAWALLLLPALLAYTQLLVIAREERFLDAAFGDEYRKYRLRVRRWL